MKKRTILLTLLFTHGLTMSTATFARDDVQDFSIKDALAQSAAIEKLGNSIQFYFADQPHGPVEKEFGVFTSNKKTNAFGKSDLTACQWAFLSAMKSLKQRAESEGGNAVIEIKSNYKKNLSASAENFKCGAGAIMAGVALQGKVVKLAK